MNRHQRRLTKKKEVSKDSHSLTELNKLILLAIQYQTAGQFDQAIDTYRIILKVKPDYVEVHNNLGCIFENQDKFDEAAACYKKALSFKPDYAEAHNNLAYILVKQCKFHEALACCEQALALKPGDAQIHNTRGVILLNMQRHEEALASFDKAIALKADYDAAYNNRGNTLQEMLRYPEALANYDKAIALNPYNAKIYNNMGNILQKMHRYDEALVNYDKAMALTSDPALIFTNRGNVLRELKRYAEALEHLDKAIAITPGYDAAYNNRGLTLHDMLRYPEALASYDKALALNPINAEAYNNRGITLHEMKCYDEALASYDKAIMLSPGYAETYNNRGSTLISIGDMQGAEMMFMKALALKPDYPNPLFNLAVIRKYEDADDAHIKQIQTLLKQPSASSDREYLYFALGKIYDDCGRYDEAFECYRQGNQLRNTTVSYNPDQTTGMFNNIISIFSRDFLAQPFAHASASSQPLFIVGMPRSGTTLIASILSNHRSIETAGELATMTECTIRLPELLGNGIAYPTAAQHCTPAIAARLIQDYEERLKRDACPAVPYIIDKQPMNFRHLGFISMLFPRARIIHCTRHPMDTCLSNYFQRFNLNYNYAFDLRNIGHFYKEYERLMEHWRQALPVKMLEVRYEDTIMDTEKTVRTLLDFLELEWDGRCLTPHTNPCAVETSSNWQVRQPIYTQSVERWRHYEKHLAPLKEMLSS